MVRHPYLQGLSAVLLLSNLANVMARPPSVAFCPNGMAKPNFTNGDAVEVIYAQAPLFSSRNSQIGKVTNTLNLYHSAIVLAQGVDSNRHYWTLEFGFTAPSMTDLMAPQLVANESAPGGTSLVWNNDAKYCLTPGLLDGVGHWVTHFDIVASVSVDEATRVFDEFVVPLNGSQFGNAPQYQSFKVARTGFFGPIEHTFIEDLTCNHGVLWFINYLSKAGNSIPQDFEFKGTVAVVNALDLKRVDASDPQWKDVVNYYRLIGEVVSSNKSHEDKLADVYELIVERRYVFDPQSGQYFELIGNKFPWMDFRYDTLPLRGPPSSVFSQPTTVVV